MQKTLNNVNPSKLKNGIPGMLSKNLWKKKQKIRIFFWAKNCIFYENTKTK